MDKTDKKAAIISGCTDAPNCIIGGLSCKKRLYRSLVEKGYHIVDDPNNATLIVPDCHVIIGDDQIHLCEEGVQAIEDRLLNSLRKPVDGIISRLLNRRLSLAITRRLMNTSIRPNHISILTLVLGIVCGVLIANGKYSTILIGAIFLQFQSILDGVDGELARLRYQSSRLGQWLDTLSDDIAELAVLVGATVAIVTPWIVWFGVVGIITFIISKGILYYFLSTVYKSGDLQDFKWDIDGTESFGAKFKFFFRHDFLCLLILCLALLGQIDIVLLMMATGSIVMFLKLIHRSFKKRFEINKQIIERESL